MVVQCRRTRESLWLFYWIYFTQ